MPKLRRSASDPLPQSISNGCGCSVPAGGFEEIRFPANLDGALEDFYFDEGLRQSEDVECWLRIAIQTHWLLRAFQALTLYRVNSGRAISQLAQTVGVLEKVKDTRASSKRSLSAKTWLEPTISGMQPEEQ